MRHIIEEFTRVAMSFPHIRFILISNNQQIFHLEQGSLKQRIIQLLGNSYNAKVVSVKEETDFMKIYGFTGKPETAKRPEATSIFCKQPFHQKPISQSCGDECLSRNDTARQFSDVCSVY